jgi:hypothetical protein
MKTKLLLIYGYLVPFVGSAIVSIMPFWTGLLNAEDFSRIFADNRELVLVILAFFGAIAIPFQNQVLTESDEYVLSVLSKSRVRRVFQTASAVQAVVIILMALFILLLSSVKLHPAIIGPLELFAVSLISFEFIAMVSNGCAYTEIREKIIARVSMESKMHQK